MLISKKWNEERKEEERKSIERHPEVIATSSPQQGEPGTIMQVWRLLGIKSVGGASTSLKARYSTLASVRLYLTLTPSTWRALIEEINEEERDPLQSLE